MQNQETFLDVINQYSNSHFLLNDISVKTRANYYSYIAGIKQYLNNIGRIDILISELDPPIIERMYVSLLSRGGLTNSARSIELCKRVSEWAFKMGIISVDKIYCVKVKRSKTKEIIFLEENELEKLINSEVHNKKLDIVKDLYLFQVLTGMSYGDLWSFKYIKDNVGEWLYNKRKKNQREYWIPLTEKLKGVDMVRGILKKYNYNLPKVRMRDYNPLIREVAEQADIKKYLTSHTGRKTFANQARQDGWSDDNIAYMMGHENVSTTIKHYFNRSRKKLELEVKQRQAS